MVNENVEIRVRAGIRRIYLPVLTEEQFDFLNRTAGGNSEAVCVIANLLTQRLRLISSVG